VTWICRPLQRSQDTPGDGRAAQGGRLLALIEASSVLAVANIRAITAATSGKRFGSVTVGCNGQRMRTMAGSCSGE
jgi:hypothetical protein